jgi:hypothetical protein
MALTITRARSIKRDKPSIHERVGLPKLGRISTINSEAYSMRFRLFEARKCGAVDYHNSLSLQGPT